jgi:hypothetical protein
MHRGKSERNSMKNYKSIKDVFADGLAVCGVDVLSDTVLVRFKEE